MNDKNSETYSLGERMYRLREKNGDSQEDLAEKLDVSRQTISNWENDKVKIDAYKAAELCRLYGVSMDELFFGKTCTAESVALKKFSKVKAAILICLLFGVLILSVAAVAFFIFSAEETTSSALYFGRSAVCGIAALIGAVLCAVFAVGLYRELKNKK